MSVNSSYNELASEVDYYRSLFQLIHIHPMVNGGLSWRIGDDGKLRQIQLGDDRNLKEKEINPKELAVLAIAFCEGRSSSSETRLIDQGRIMAAGIVSEEDIVQSTKLLLKNIRRDHLTSQSFQQNGVENAAKIVIARKAYEGLAQYFSEDPERLNDPEAVILLAYTIAIIGYRFELRPYMINPGLMNIDWVSVYDSIFSSFSDVNKQYFIDSGYYVLWETIRKIRDEIFNKKEAKKEGNSLLMRLKTGPNITKILMQISNQSPPSASSHPQGPLSP